MSEHRAGAALYSSVNATLNREHVRVLREYALKLRERATNDVSEHVARCDELAARLEVVARREQPVVHARDLAFLDKVIARLLDLERDHPLAGVPPQHTRLTLGRELQHLREMAAVFVPADAAPAAPALRPTGDPS